MICSPSAALPKTLSAMTDGWAYDNEATDGRVFLTQPPLLGPPGPVLPHWVDFSAAPQSYVLIASSQRIVKARASHPGG